MLKNASKKKKPMQTEAASFEDSALRYRRQIMANTGVGATQSIDPVYQLVGGFAQTFDAVGKARNAARHTGEKEKASPQTEHPREGQSASREQLSAAELRRRHDSPVYSHSARQLAEGDFCDRFSSHAFNYGTLAASVMAGQGKAMFTTCFRRAGTHARPATERERGVLEGKSVHAKVRNQPASVVFGQEAHTAVGLVVDSIRGSSRILEIFRQLAGDEESHSQNRMEKHDVETMRELYPFLQLRQDRALIAQYRAQLNALENDTSPQGLMQKKSLETALKKATAVMRRKKAQQRRFLTVLSQITANVREAEKMFSADGFADRLLEEMDQMPDIPPEDPGSGEERRTLENSPLGELLDALLGGEESETEASDGRERADAAEKTAADESGEEALGSE